MRTKPTKAEKELLQRIEKLEMRWQQENREAEQARAIADLTSGVICELKDTVSALRAAKTVRPKKGRKQETLGDQLDPADTRKGE